MNSERAIAMNGAAWLASFVASFGGRDQWIKSQIESANLWPDKSRTLKAEMLGKVYDLAIPPKVKDKISKK